MARQSSAAPAAQAAARAALAAPRAAPSASLTMMGYMWTTRARGDWLARQATAPSAVPAFPSSRAGSRAEPWRLARTTATRVAASQAALLGS